MKSKGYSEFEWPIKARFRLFRYILIVAIQKDLFLTLFLVYIITIQRQFVPVGAISFNNSEAHF